MLEMLEMLEMLGIFGISGLSFLLVALFTPLLIWVLRTLKLTQPIRSQLPPDHQAKRGTPLMAGLILLIGIATSLQFQPAPLMLFLCASVLLFSSVGFMDDFKKAAHQDPSIFTLPKHLWETPDRLPLEVHSPS